MSDEIVMLPAPVGAIVWDVPPMEPRAVTVIALRQTDRGLDALVVDVDGDMHWSPTGPMEWDTLKPTIEREMVAVNLYKQNHG